MVRRFASGLTYIISPAGKKVHGIRFWSAAPLPYPWRKSARRAFQSGRKGSTSAQNSFWWLGCTKWQYSCTINIHRRSGLQRQPGGQRDAFFRHVAHAPAAGLCPARAVRVLATQHPGKGRVHLPADRLEQRKALLRGGGQSACFRAARATRRFAAITQPILAGLQRHPPGLALARSGTRPPPPCRPAAPAGSDSSPFFRTSSYSSPATRRIWPAILVRPPVSFPTILLYHNILRFGC